MRGSYQAGRTNDGGACNRPGGLLFDISYIHPDTNG
jgi:hypothetical protein